MFIVMMFSFGAGAFLLMIRFVTLLLYMVFSPLMFIGWVFPQLQRHTREFWSGFLGRAFFAPIYLLLLYVSISIVNAAFTAGVQENGAQNILGMMNNSGADRLESIQSPNGLPIFIISSIFLIASIVISQKMGAVGGSTVVSAGKRVGNRVRARATTMTKNAAIGTARVVAAPVTLPARKVSNTLGNKLDSGLTSFQAKERTSTLGRVAGSVSRWNGVDRKVRSGAQKLKDNKMGTGYTQDQDLLYKQGVTNRIDQKNAIDTAEKVIQGTDASAEELTEQFKELSDVMRKMSNDDVMNLGYDKLKNETFAINLKDSHIEHFEKSGKFSAQQVQQIKGARKSAIKKTIDSGSIANPNNPNASNAEFMDTQRQNVFRGNVNDIGKLPTEAFTSPSSYKYITPAMIEAKIKNGVSSAEVNDMKNALEIYRSYATTSDNNVWNKWQNSNSVHAAKFFS
jgi:hypothetical protein